MLDEQNLAITVKRHFILANAFKEPAKRKLRLPELEEEYERLRLEIWGLKSSELDLRITDQVRLARYNSMTWQEGHSFFEDMGVWPKMQGCNISLTLGNVPETARRMANELQTGSQLIPEDFRFKLASLRDLSSFLYSRFPLVLFPGGEIREKDYNAHARGAGEPICKIFQFDIDDGCSRSIAYELEGINKAPTIFGGYMV
jgi:hypothetical protein